MKISQISLAALISLSFITGCTPNINPDHYSTDSTQAVSSVTPGVVINTSSVSVSNSGTGWAGTLAGGATGAVLGGSMGQGTGSLLMGIGGALLGGVAGNAAEKKLSSQDATQYIVKLNNGSTISVTQGGQPFAVGTKVLLLSGNPARLIVDPGTGSTNANS